MKTKHDTNFRLLAIRNVQQAFPNEKLYNGHVHIMTKANTTHSRLKLNHRNIQIIGKVTLPAKTASLTLRNINVKSDGLFRKAASVFFVTNERDEVIS